MTSYEDLPKGMTKMPEEFAQVDTIEEGLTHTKVNYSNAIRDKLAELKDMGVSVDIQRLEIVEQVGSPSMLSLVAEIRSTP
jgi:hypothetical protein